MEVFVIFDGTSAFISENRPEFDDMNDGHYELDSTWSDIDAAQDRADILNSEITDNF